MRGMGDDASAALFATSWQKGVKVSKLFGLILSG